MPLDLVSTTEEKSPVFLNPTTIKGKPAKIDGLATVTFLTGGATFAPATEQETADYAANGFPGFIGFAVSEDIGALSTGKIEADTDLGAGVTTITETINYLYSDPQAANLGATSGAAVPK